MQLDAHHATLYIAPTLSTASLPHEASTPGTDVTHVDVAQLTIAEVRTLTAIAYQAPLNAPVRYIVVAAGRITVEAQNALLKLLEEPPVTTRLILVVPSESVLLATVRSRVLRVDTEETVVEDEAVEAFVAERYAARLKRVQAMAKQDDPAVLRSLIIAVAKRVAVRAKPDASLCRMLNQTSLDAQKPGASLKMLAEQLALRIPVMSP